MERLKPLLGRTLVLVAHPDDEAVGCGGLLQRMRDPVVVFATDGAPRSQRFWEAHGCRETYARVRRREAEQALGHVGVKQVEFLPLLACGQVFVDQDLFLFLPQARECLKGLVEEWQPEALLTLAYEGGHPDHDTCSFLTSILAREYGLPVWEMPLYHRAPDGNLVFTQFLEPTGNEVLFDATPEEVEQKRKMLEAYKSQEEILLQFNAAVERFRPMTSYDFTKPPHSGVLNYEAWQWPMTSQQVAAAFKCCLDARHKPRGVPDEPGVRGVA